MPYCICCAAKNNDVRSGFVFDRIPFAELSTCPGGAPRFIIMNRSSVS